MIFFLLPNIIKTEHFQQFCLEHLIFGELNFFSCIFVGTFYLILGHTVKCMKGDNDNNCTTNVLNHFSSYLVYKIWGKERNSFYCLLTIVKKIICKKYGWHSISVKYFVVAELKLFSVSAIPNISNFFCSLHLYSNLTIFIIYCTFKYFFLFSCFRLG